ncbi:hypothetical protein EJF36_18615 [Bacillus sp. HMF5848]|uniref:hypothetical protein n=1 Tax=Bacillus sp. HMF5848 TaxID=2495421 RepID=UPI000F779B2B|nr:hypothetical protein [Bacillus sp. HMF5848]RSK28721.1 hypothetical protein EJF36_18615 [Bacillus sp. HMF5848]
MSKLKWIMFVGGNILLSIVSLYIGIYFLVGRLYGDQPLMHPIIAVPIWLALFGLLNFLLLREEQFKLRRWLTAFFINAAVFAVIYIILNV